MTRVLREAASEKRLKMYADLGWARAEEIMRVAADVGNAAHERIESFCEGKAADVYPEASAHPKVKAALRSFRVFHAAYAPTYLQTEVTCTSRRHRYLCRFDQVLRAERLGELVMVDWKTSSAVDELYVLQLAANAQAYLEEFGRMPDAGAVVRLSKDPGMTPMVEVHVWRNLRRFVPVFRGLLTYWRWKHGWGGWARTPGPRVDVELAPEAHA